MPAPAYFDEDYVMEQVKARLGYPVIQIEITDDQIQSVISMAIEKFQEYRPKQQIQAQLLSKGVHKIEPPEGSMGLLDVDHTDQVRLDQYSVEAALLYDPFYFISSGAIGGVDIQLYDMTRRWMEVVGRVFSAEFDYEMTDEGLFIFCPSDVKIKILWAMPYEDLSDVRREYQELFIDLVLARSRQIVGAIRGKYGSVPGAGTMVQLDGEYQRQKGEEDEQRIIDELRRISPHFIPSYG